MREENKLKIAKSEKKRQSMLEENKEKQKKINQNKLYS